MAGIRNPYTFQKYLIWTSYRNLNEHLVLLEKYARLMLITIICFGGPTNTMVGIRNPYPFQMYSIWTAYQNLHEHLAFLEKYASLILITSMLDVRFKELD